MIYQGRARYRVHEAILHTSATPASWQRGKTVETMRDEIRGWHRAQGWRDIGYHRVIAPDGTIAVGRSLWEIGAHVRERNRGTVGICLIPVRDVPSVMLSGSTCDDYYTIEQRHALTLYLEELAELTHLKWVTGHNAYAPKACPGFEVRSTEWLPA
jgi:hypothetical protein